MRLGCVLLEGQDRATDQRLAELISEVARPIGGLGQDLLRRLVEPRARLGMLLPATPHLTAWVAGHIDRRTCEGYARTAARHTVADLAARTGGRAIEGLDGGREVVRLGLEAQHAVDRLTDEIVGLIPRGGGKLLQRLRSVDEGDIVLVGRD